MAGKRYHGAAHRRLGAPVVRAAYADPSYRCPRCGLTHAEAVKAYGDDGAAWERGHKQAGRLAVTSAEYQAEHAHCNRSAGATHGNQRRNRKQSRDW